MIPKEVSSKILDDAREKIASFFRIAREEGALRKWADGKSDADEILAISGTTDIECPKCGGDGIFMERCGDSSYNSKSCDKCDNGVIKYPWNVSVVLDNGELPKETMMIEGFGYFTDKLASKIASKAGYKQVVDDK